MSRNIYIVHAHGALGVTRVVYDENTPGDIIICASGTGVRAGHRRSGDPSLWLRNKE